MIAPLKTMTVTPGNDFGVLRSGSGLPDKNGRNRHIGVDLRAGVDTKVLAPGAGTVTIVDNIGLKLVEIRIGSKLHRFLHLDDNVLKVGQKVKAGQHIGNSGNTGGVAAHLHWDIRKNGTHWASSYYNYEDPMKLLKKEKIEMITNNGLNVLWRYYLGKSPSAASRAKYVGKYTFDKVRNIVIEGISYKAEVAEAKAGKLNTKDHLPAKIRAVFKQ